MRYRIKRETKKGEIHTSNATFSESEAEIMCDTLNNKFPKVRHWYEKVLERKEDINQLPYGMMVMTQSEFQEWVDIKLKTVKKLLEIKGTDYSRLQEYAFRNFEGGAKVGKMSMPKYLMILATKHWISLTQDMDDMKNLPTVEARATDIIVYMLLLMAMTEEILKESVE
jgi:hypothetical protein